MTETNGDSENNTSDSLEVRGREVRIGGVTVAVVTTPDGEPVQAHEIALNRSIPPTEADLIRDRLNERLQGRMPSIAR